MDREKRFIWLTACKFKSVTPSQVQLWQKPLWLNYTMVVASWQERYEGNHTVRQEASESFGATLAPLQQFTLRPSINPFQGPCPEYLTGSSKAPLLTHHEPHLQCA